MALPTFYDFFSFRPARPAALFYGTGSRSFKALTAPASFRRLRFSHISGSIPPLFTTSFPFPALYPERPSFSILSRATFPSRRSPCPSRKSRPYRPVPAPFERPAGPGAGLLHGLLQVCACSPDAGVEVAADRDREGQDQDQLDEILKKIEEQQNCENDRYHDWQFSDTRRTISSINNLLRYAAAFYRKRPERPEIVSP